MRDVTFILPYSSKSDDYEDDCFLGCYALMMQAASTSEKSVNFYQIARRYFPEVIFTFASVRT
jgi:hypothetical protein